MTNLRFWNTFWNLLTTGLQYQGILSRVIGILRSFVELSIEGLCVFEGGGNR